MEQLSLGAPIQMIGKPNNLKIILGARKPKVLKTIAKLWSGHLCLREE
jgi:hypothetical protein